MGPGIYPKTQAPQPPAHSHYLCDLSPVINLIRPNPKFNPNAERAFLESLPAKEARAVAGSFARLERAKAGESLEAIYNEGKDELYRWKRVGEVGQTAPMNNDDDDFLEGRSRARGERPKQAKPTEPGTLSTDQLSKIEGDAKAYVVGQILLANSILERISSEVVIERKSDMGIVDRLWSHLHP